MTPNVARTGSFGVTKQIDFLEAWYEFFGS